MDSGPSTPSLSQGSGVGGSSNPSRFRLSEFLASSPHDRPRASSLKGKQSQQDSSRSRTYDPHASTPMYTFNGSPPEPNPPPKRSRTSFLATAQDALMLKKFGRKKKPHILPTPSILPDVIEITATETKRNSIIAATLQEEEERGRLRDAAAHSIGLDPDLMSKSPTSVLDHHDFGFTNDHAESDYDYDVETENPASASHGPSREGSCISNSMWANDTTPSLGHHGRAGSVTVAAKSSDTCAPALTPTIPVYPTTVAGLADFTQLSRLLPKYYPGNQLLKFALTKQWKNRFIVMSSPVQPNQSLSSSHSSRPTPTTAPTVSYLHLFKSNNPSEKELERLEINEDSVVFVNENNEEISGKRNVLRVGGVDCGAMKRDLNVEEGGRTIWLLQVSDQQELQRWISAIKNSVLSQRSVRAGLGLPTSSYGATEPRGDLDVMLSMRAQGLISPRNKGTTPNSSSSSNPNGNSNYTNPRSPPQPKAQTTAPPPSSKSPIPALKGFFVTPNRSRTPSLVGSSGHVKADEDSPPQSSAMSTPNPTHHHPTPTTSAGTNILNRLRGNSEARPLSPLGYTPSVASISTATNNNIGAADPSLSSVELERKILADQADAATNGASGSNWMTTQRKQGPVSQQLVGLNELMNSVSSPLQPPPWRKQSTGPAAVTQSLPQSQVDLSEPDSGTYRYLHTNMSAVESFGVHNTHPPSRRSANGTRPSLDLSSRRDSQKSGSLNGSGIVTGGSVKGSLGSGGGEKKPRPPSWTSTSSNNESATSGPKRWSRQGVLPKRLTPPSGALPSIPVSGVEEEAATTPRVASPHPYSFDRERSPSRSSSYSTPNSPANSLLNSNANSPQNAFSTTSFLKRQSGSSFQSATSTSNVSSQMHTRTSTGSGTGNSGVGSYISRSALSIQNRLSLAPPQRPAPNTALPPTPTELEPRDSPSGLFNAGPPSPPSSKSSFRDSLTQRALRLSLAGLPQKTPPTTGLPPRPDEPPFTEGHRRSNSAGASSIGATSRPTTLYTIPGSPGPAEGDPGVLPPVLTERERQQNTLNLNLRQRLRMLSAPPSTTAPTTPPPTTPPSNPPVSAQLLAADQTIVKPRMEGEDSYGSVHTRFLVGEPITTMQNDPSFLLMSTPTMAPPPLPTRAPGQASSRPSSLYIPSNPSSPLPTQTQFPTSSMLPPPQSQYPTQSQRSPQLAPLPVPPRSPFRQLPKPPSPAPSQNSKSQTLPLAPSSSQQLAPEITSLSPPPWKAARRSSVVPTAPPKDNSTEAEEKDDRPPPTFMDSPPLLGPPRTPPVPITPRMSSADSITNLSI